jgi:hypothetical protein
VGHFLQLKGRGVTFENKEETEQTKEIYESAKNTI